MSAARSAEEVPIRPAATVMLVDDRPDLHVLMLRRRAGSEFVGGMSVFPGGGVDSEDDAAEVEAVCTHLDGATANQRLGVAAGGLAHWVAAIRETFEEAGLLLARGSDGDELLPLRDPEVEARFAQHRAQVDTGAVRLLDVVRGEGLSLATDGMFYAARWITPLGPPRRYDTRFFLAAAPAHQRALPDEREAVHSEWVRPGEALSRFAEGDIALLPPTVGMLRILSGFPNVIDALAAAREQQDLPDQPARLTLGEHWRVLLPGDADYADAAGRDVAGWVRLEAPGGPRSEVQGPAARGRTD